MIELTKKRIIECLKEKKRFDGRNLFEYRPIEIKFGISKKAEGSAAVKIGNTEVVAGVKLDVGEPYTDSPEEGTLVVTVELLPMASEEFEPGPPGPEAIELARIIDRGIRESGFIDFKKLCIKKNELVWNIFIDVYPINHDGNLIDASCLAAVAALLDSKFPKLEEEKVQYGKLTEKKLPLTNKIPLTITFYKIGDALLLDPNSEEEEASSGRMSIALTHEGICAIQKGKEAALDKEEIFYMIDNTVSTWHDLYTKLVKKLKK